MDTHKNFMQADFVFSDNYANENQQVPKLLIIRACNLL